MPKDDKVYEVLKELREAIVCLKEEIIENGVDIYTTTLDVHLRKANELMGVWREE